MAIYLIDENFKPVLKGVDVKPRKEGEFCLSLDLPDATLREIAKAIKVQIPKGLKKAEVYKIVFDQLNLMEITTMTEETKATKQEDQVKALIKKGFEAGKDEDTILVEIVSTGVGFHAAGKLFNKITQELGLRLSASDRYEMVSKELGDKWVPKDYAEVNKAAEHFSKKLKSTTPAQAMASIRKYAKEHEFELPKAPKAAGGRKASGFNALVSDWILQNPQCTNDELKAFIVKQNPEKEYVVSYFWRWIQWGRQYSAVYKPAK